MAQSGADLIIRLDACWEMGRTGLSSQGLAEAQALLVRARQTGNVPATAFALTCNAWFCLQLGYPDEGTDAAVEARTLYAALGSDWGQALSRSVYSWLLIEQGLSDLAFDEAVAAVDIAERTDDLVVKSFAMCCKGMALMMCREDGLAFPLLEQSLATAEAAGDACTISLCLINMAYSLMSQAELADADGDQKTAARLRERSLVVNNRAIAVAQGYGDLWNLRTALCNGAETYVILGRMDLAQDYLDRWKALVGKTGAREDIHYLYTFGEMLTKQGRLPEARDVCGRAVALAAEGTQMDNRANTLRRLSDVEAAMGDYHSALTHYRAYHDVFVAQMGQVTRRRAQFAEMQLQNEQLREKARRLEAEALQDPLTGLANRRAFDAAFQALDGRKFSLALLDLDHFKSINDTYSHVAGDAVLVRIASILLDWDGKVQAFRVGGEEFALLIEGVSLADAYALADTIRVAIAGALWDATVPGRAVTASIGVVDSSEVGHRQMMAEADARLYAAKGSGRNRVSAGVGPTRRAFRQ